MTALAGAGARRVRAAAALLRDASRACTAAAAERQPLSLAREACTSAREVPGAPPRDPDAAPQGASAARGARDLARRAAPHRGFSAQAAPSEPVNPFAIVSDELEAVSERMRAAVVSEVPTLATAAEYFFKEGALGKRMRPTVLLLVASALSRDGAPGAALASVDHSAPRDTPAGTRRRQQRLAEVAELIHVASLLHDDVIDSAATRRGMRALNIEFGNKLAILAGDFLLARASVTLASLRDTDVVMLLSTVIEHLVTGEVMQMTAKPEELTSWEHYSRKTHFKTASLIAKSCKAIAMLGGSPPAEAEAAYEYGRHLGLAFQYIDDVLDFTGSALSLGKPALNDLRSGIATAPVLFAAARYPALTKLVQRRFKNEGDVEQARLWVADSDGIERARELAAEHAEQARKALDAFPPTECPHALRARAGLVELTQRVLRRSK